jgi:hypothetical protein
MQSVVQNTAEGGAEKSANTILRWKMAQMQISVRVRNKENCVNVSGFSVKEKGNIVSTIREEMV